MSAAGSLDLRLPIGGLFVILGVILIGYGLATTGNAMYARSDGLNINLWWGVVMLVTGGLFLLFARRDARAELAAAERGTAAPPHKPEARGR